MNPSLPIFTQRTSPKVRLIVFSLLSLIVMVADHHLANGKWLRQQLSMLIYPFQVVASQSQQGWDHIVDVSHHFSTLQHEKKQLTEQLALRSIDGLRIQQISSENDYLRRLLAARQRLKLATVMAEILYESRDPFNDKLILDKGSYHGVQAGQPVLDDTGIVGQISRVYPFIAELTLLSDKTQPIPVMVVGNNLRGLVYGGDQFGTLEMKFMPHNAEIEVDDLLVTSGVDGLYPAGLPVAKVTSIDRGAPDAFAKVVATPLGKMHHNSHFLILSVDTTLPLSLEEAAQRQKRESDKLAKNVKPYADDLIQQRLNALEAQRQASESNAATQAEAQTPADKNREVSPPKMQSDRPATNKKPKH
jgi:rod shape-determining protein MreC